MPLSGHTSSLTFATSGFTAAITEIGGATHSREDLKTSDLSTTNYHDYQPGDLVEGGESTFTFFYDPDEQPPIAGARENITRTFPIPAGGATGATKQQQGYIKSWEEPTSVTDELMMCTCTIKWSGDPTWTDST